MPLYSRRINVHGPQKRVERHVADIFVIIQQKSAEDVDGEDSETALGFDVHDGEHGLVENGVANVLTGFRVGGNLGQYVVHCFGRFGVVFAKYPEKAEDFNLQLV